MSNPQGVFVQFFTDSIEIAVESERQGRPIFKDVAFIRKIVPGDKTNVVERVAKDWDKQKHPKEWEAYQRSITESFTGTPLEQWPQITRAQVKEAKYFEIHTVEQLAEISDLNCQKLGMGFQELRNKAKAFLAAAAGTANETAQAAENQRLRQEMEELRLQMKAVSDAAMSVKPEVESPKRGRKPKQEVELA